MDNIEVQIGSSPEDGSETGIIVIPADKLEFLHHILESYKLCQLPFENEDGDWLGAMELFVRQLEEAIEEPLQ